MGEMQIFFWIFVVLFVVIGLGTMSEVSLMLEDDKNREMKQREQAQIRERKQLELTTISEEEQELIRKILENHQWKTMISGPYKGKSHPPKEAAELAMRYAKAFAISNGYDEKIITKLYYLYNSTYGEACNEKVKYDHDYWPAERDVLTGRITPAKDYKTVRKRIYSIRFLILE